MARLLIANRGEIAIRIARTAAEMGIACVAVHSEEDGESAHLRHADAVHALAGRGAAAYLDIGQLVAVAKAEGCTLVHPGYGFLSENAGFARACAEAGLTFIGPLPELLDLFGDKARARALARECGVPILDGTAGPTSLDEARAFLDALGPGGAIMLKAVAGGGGRGMRVVRAPQELEAAYARCQSEAKRSFGQDAVYVERFMDRARHIEIQVVGDGQEVSHLWERECSLQRAHQKLVEIAPSPSLSQPLRERLTEAACRMAAACGYASIGTFEFLVDADGGFAFIEANPRIQVEHTITEEVMGIDLVRLQLDLAAGRSLADLSLRQSDIGRPRGHAIQLRLNMEAIDPRGGIRPGGGTLTAFAPPTGPGVRVDTFGEPGYRTVASFDSLLAKLVVSAPGGFDQAVKRAARALDEFRIEGAVTNRAFLRALLDHPAVLANQVHTRFIEEHVAELLAAMPAEPEAFAVSQTDGPPGSEAVASPLLGVVTSVDVAVGDKVRRGQQLAIVEAMKMEHPVRAERGGIVRALAVGPGDQVAEGGTILHIEPVDDGDEAGDAEAAIDLDHIRPDLATVLDRIAETGDARRPAAVAKRRERGQRTARENVEHLIDPGSFVEYGGLALAFQRRSRTVEELRQLSPADGLVMGLGTVHAEAFGPERSRVALAAYDGSVFAGTQGYINHRKLDRMMELAAERKLPFVLFAEGGGGRPSDDPIVVAGLDVPTFARMGALSGKVPVVGIVSGRCFAGNAALLGCCDVVIATEDATIGMGGPAMIDGAGLGVFAAEQVGPIAVQSANGVVDIRVADEAAAVEAAKAYLSYFQGALPGGEAADQRLLRSIVPENRLRAYDIRDAIALIADSGSVLELRAGFGRGTITALIRVDGRPIGLIANNPQFNAGAIDADGADKAARFLRLCDAHGLPVVSLVDTPGIMVGPEAEKTALVRHAARLFVTAARLQVPVFAVVVRKAYGLGAMAAAAGSMHKPFFSVAWPSGEVGGMGLEGAVRLGYRRQLEAIADPAERQAWFDARVAELYEQGKALSAAANFELDAVIDPADTRRWIIAGLDATAPVAASGGFIDTW